MSIDFDYDKHLLVSNMNCFEKCLLDFKRSDDNNLGFCHDINIFDRLMNIYKGFLN